MTKEEKRNVIIAALLAVGAVVIIFLWGKHAAAPGTLNVAQPDTPILPDTTGAGDTTAPSYTNYNIPGYTPPNAITLPPSVFNTGSGSGGACGCQDQCGTQTANTSKPVPLALASTFLP